MAAADDRAPDERRAMLALAALVLGACAMGASPIFVRLADVGPYASAFWRTFLALPFLWAWAQLAARRTGGAGAPTVRALLMPAVLLTGLFFAGDLFFWHLSILATTVANATFFATTAPIWVALAAWALYAERIAARTLAGLVLCIAGGLALIGQSYGYAPENLRGDLYGLITAVFFGFYILALRAARQHFDAARVTFLSTAVTAACLFVVAVLADDAVLPRSLAGVGALLGLALISQVGGQGLLAVALGTLPATFSSMVIFLEAIAAAGFAWALLGERLSLLQACGGALILTGIWMARPRPDQPRRATP
jgi:drug/metabolite transporter (DMT)-like permease